MILAYILKSTLCFAFLLGFYKLLLESKALHYFKRFYLLGSLFFSLIIPLVTFTYTSSTPSEEIWVEDFVKAYENPTLNQVIPLKKESTNTSYVSLILSAIYGVGFVIFGTRFSQNLLRLKRKINTAETHPQKDFTLALLPQIVIPHSFLKFIFLTNKQYHNQEIPAEVIAHEATHVRQKHSLDILFIEIVQVLFWFNPLFWFAKKSIRLNHEFLADQGALQKQKDLARYQNILLSFASSTHHTALESLFNYSSTKKRILMLSQTFSRKRAALSALLLLPIVALCLFLFNNEIKAQEKIVNDLDPVTQFMEGAERNGKKPLVIEVKNDQITVNGHPSAVARFQKDIDAITRDWEETDYTNATTSFLFKDNSKEFMERLEVAYAKTHISKANDGSKLFPAAPPAPIAPKSLEDLPSPPPAPSVADHLLKMNGLEGAFYYEGNKITYQKAKQLIEDNENLNVKTPYPYSKSPETYLTNPQEELLAPLPLKEQIKNNSNPKKFFVDLEENTIRINGNLVALKDVAQSFDNHTKNWTDQDFQSKTILLANLHFQLILDYDFLQALEKEMRKTDYFKKTGDLKTPPPSFHSGLISAILIPELSSDWKVYFEDKNISIEAAKEVLNKEEWITYKVFNSNNNKQPEIYFYKTPGKITESQDKSVSKSELKTYNRLAKKYNANPTGVIIQREVALMKDIYSRMTKAQQKAGQPYPKLPPPPKSPRTLNKKKAIDKKK